MIEKLDDVYVGVISKKDIILKINELVDAVNELQNNWHTGYTQRDNDGITDHDSGEIYTEENVLRWAYIKDLLALETKLERTRKALDVAKHVLQELKDVIACPPDISYETCVSMYTDGALQEITTLEQKDKE